MATPSDSSVFVSLFQCALEEYEKETGINLVEHPLAAKLERCNDVESITQALQEQTQAFREFRGDKHTIIKFLKNAVQAVHNLSEIVALGESIGLPKVPFVKTIHTCIGALLGAVKDVSASYDALIDLFETMGNFLKRLDIYTNLKVSPTKAMTEMIVKLLIVLISTLAVATKQIKQGRFKKFGKKLLGDNEVEEVLRRLDRLTVEEARMTAVNTLEVVCGLVEKWSQVMNNSEVLTNDVQRNLGMTQQLTSNVNKAMRDQLLKDLKAWLSPPDPWRNHHIGQKARHEGTARWFIESKTYAEWKSSSTSLLWVNGKPGSGKSVLCYSIIEDIDYMRKSGLASLAFYYFSFGEKEKNALRGLLSSLIFQLCDQSDSYYATLSHLYSTHREGAQSPDDFTLIECLKDMLMFSGQATVYLILDALDECPNGYGTPSPREEVLMFVEDLVDLGLPNLRICLTSRPEVDIKDILEPLKSHSISLHDEEGQKQDILHYIKSVVYSDTRMRRWRAEDKELVIDELSQKADGMFRWVYCQLDFLRRCLPGRIQKALKELPTTLDATYERTLKDIDEPHREYAQRLFQCVAVASRPLRVEELAEFIAFDFKAGNIPRFHEDWRAEDPVEGVLSTCSTLLSIVDEGSSRVVQFSHFSVKEYLSSPRLAEEGDFLSRRYHISTPGAHTFVTQVCLGMLLHLDSGITSDDLQKFPLAEYAAKHWIDHARSDNALESVEDGMKQLFDSRKPHFAIWVWIHDVQVPSWRRIERTKVPFRPRGTPLHYAACCGLQAVVKFLVVERPQDVHSWGFEDMSTPLHGAASGGHVDAARVLLECGADATARATDASTPLHRASEGGHVDLARILLESGANATVQDKDGWTSLHRASYGRHEVLVRVLLDHGVDATAKDKRGSTPLHWASSWGDVKLVRLLLERGADTTAQDEDGSTPLHQASEGGHLELVRVLIEYGASATAKRKDGSTPLHRASDRGFAELALFLLKCGVDATAKNEFGSTPLHRASYLGHVDFARVLLENCAKATVQDEDGSTPLHQASEAGHVELARMLLEHGADVTAQRKDGSTPLHRASVRGQVEVAVFLLDSGADATARNRDGTTPLHWASYEGHAELARALLKRSANAMAQDQRGLTPLHWASNQGHVKVVHVLLEGGANVTAQDEQGSSPLHQASYRGHADVARVLLERGADASARCKFGWTPLHRASEVGHVGIARILLERHADANARDKDGWTPLHRASFRGDADLVRVLLEGGADVTIQDEHGWSPLHRASYEGKAEASRVLLKRGAFATAPDKFGYTPLYLAQHAGHPELVRILLECAVDVRAVVQAFLNSKAASGEGQKTLGTSGKPVEVANVSENGIAGS